MLSRHSPSAVSKIALRETRWFLLRHTECAYYLIPVRLV